MSRLTRACREVRKRSRRSAEPDSVPIFFLIPAAAAVAAPIASAAAPIAAGTAAGVAGAGAATSAALSAAEGAALGSGAIAGSAVPTAAPAATPALTGGASFQGGLFGGSIGEGLTPVAEAVASQPELASLGNLGGGEVLAGQPGLFGAGETAQLGGLGGGGGTLPVGGELAGVLSGGLAEPSVASLSDIGDVARLANQARSVATTEPQGQRTNTAAPTGRSQTPRQPVNVNVAPVPGLEGALGQPGQEQNLAQILPILFALKAQQSQLGGALR